jgi:hypothetical protein
MAWKKEHHQDVEVNYDVALPLVEVLLIENTTREARMHYAKELREAASFYEVWAFGVAEGDGYGFGDDEAESPDWLALDKSGELTKILYLMQCAAMCRFWAKFLRDPADVVWKLATTPSERAAAERHRLETKG